LISKYKGFNAIRSSSHTVSFGLVVGRWVANPVAILTRFAHSSAAYPGAKPNEKTHRNIEFDVHPLGDGRWEWIAYPKLGEGERFAGAVEGDEENATTAARAAIDGRFGPPPDPAKYSGTSNWDPTIARQRNTAFLDSGGSQVFPPLPPANSAATVDTPPGAFQPGAFQADAFQTGTAPREIRLETGKYALEEGSINVGAGGMAANADVASAQRRVTAPFRDNPERAEMLARALATTIRQEIKRLEDQRRNEPEWRDEIDFLRGVADALDNIVAAIAGARRAATPEERDRKFTEAEHWATSLAKAGKDFAERNYERVVDFGGYCPMTVLGTLLFTQLLGVSPDVAFVGAMGLLGFGKKKD